MRWGRPNRTARGLPGSPWYSVDTLVLCYIKGLRARHVCSHRGRRRPTCSQPRLALRPAAQYAQPSGTASRPESPPASYGRTTAPAIRPSQEPINEFALAARCTLVIFCTKMMKRFSISVDEQDYRRLKALAQSRKPKLSLQYVVNFAIQELLRRADDPQLRLSLGDPLESRNRRTGRGGA